ncbi:hypothetical protein HMPREF3291_23490 [Bacillus sp. HMSC76G11]|nr:hypothetical protein HMPREF3291_23490 [Bacillus sp. HMSC76G11]
MIFLDADKENDQRVLIVFLLSIHQFIENHSYFEKMTMLLITNYLNRFCKDVSFYKDPSLFS